MTTFLFALLFSVSQLFGGITLNQNQTKYKPLNATGVQSGTATDPTVVSNHAVIYATIFSDVDTISGLIMQLDVAPGTGQSVTQTLWVNGAATSLTATISDNATSASDYTNSVAVSAGDIAAWKITTSSGFQFNNNLIYAAKQR